MTETIETTDDAGAAVRMLERLERMSEPERVKLYAFMEKDENARRVMTYALGATAAQLRELLEIIEGDLARRRAGAAVINNIDCNPTTAARIYTSVAGGNCFPDDGFRRFDEVLYRNPDGYWFLVRPLAPDEAQEWMEYGRHDSVLARRLFPGAADGD